MTEERRSVDYVIVGAGSAGCVLANRLTEDADTTAALLEAGGRNTSILVRMPAGVSELIKDRNDFNWGFFTEPEPHLDNRKLFWPRGKGWGGSSSINAMIYIRGHPRDYDQWRQFGLTGWGWDDVLPYFRRAERHERGASAVHGGEGPLRVTGSASRNPIYPALIEAGVQAGLPVCEDFNGPSQDGMGFYDRTLTLGRRWSAADAYLRPILGARQNLTALTGVRATRVLIEDGRAIGVEYVEDGETKRIYAEREVLLTSGAIQSPQLLQLSGVGNPDMLRSVGVDVVHELPGVGENLQDHLDLAIVYDCPQPVTIASIIKGWRKPVIGIQYMLTGKGPGAETYVEAGGYLRSREGLDRPDLQLHCVLAAGDGKGNIIDGFSLRVCQLRPESRGRVSLHSASPLDDPKIEAGYLSDPSDLPVLRQAVKIVRDIAGRPALDPWRGEEMKPGPMVQTDAEIDAWIRQSAETIYHPVGTCKMGTDADPRAVVDAELKVRGIEGLRVIDASVMPTLIGGNTNAPTMMIAEKASDMIRGRLPLRPIETEPAASPKAKIEAA